MSSRIVRPAGFELNATNTTFKVLNVPGDDPVALQRSANANAVRNYFGSEFIEMTTPTFLARTPKDFTEFFKSNPDFGMRDQRWEWGYKVGNVAIWASNYLLLNDFLKTNYEFLIVIEDDLWWKPELLTEIKNAVRDLPRDFDFLSFWAPDNNFMYFNAAHLVLSKVICRPYQRVSKLIMVYSRKGAARIIEYANDGIDGPGDFILYSQREFFNGYARIPSEIQKAACTVLNIPSTHYRKGVTEWQVADFDGVRYVKYFE